MIEEKSNLWASFFRWVGVPLITIVGYVLGKLLINWTLPQIDWLSSSGVWEQVNGTITLNSLDGFLAAFIVFMREAVAIGLSLFIACSLAPRSRKVVYITFVSLLGLAILFSVFLSGLVAGSGGSIEIVNNVASLLGMVVGALITGIHVWTEMEDTKQDGLHISLRVVAISLGSILTVLAYYGIFLLIVNNSATSECNIKGNISVTGEKIYHVPGENSYNKTIIDTTNGERMFCSEQQAEDAGWRHSK